MRERILIVEDDPDINRLLTTFLQKEGYETIAAFSGTEALFVLKERIDLILLDLMIPGLSGERVLEHIRESSSVPVIVISGKISLDDKVTALELGADDYITKPFEKREVLARVKAALRRAQPTAEKDQKQVLSHQGLVVDVECFRVTYQNQKIDLTQTEFVILKTLMEEPQVVFSRDKLYRRIWDEDYVGDDNAITVHISHLRQKLRQASGQEHIETVWGIGYRMSDASRL
ncbi:MAG: response regulator transcription factor [Limnochordia bacterium]|nr:response regulator transcription factor [Limnochordia bacterium]MDD2629657.1 response regulator transcription factor [Limnochordia bacterium]MDD4518142.1 response regulator transcription factor [Limnochordia bacterium]